MAKIPHLPTLSFPDPGTFWKCLPLVLFALRFLHNKARDFGRMDRR